MRKWTRGFLEHLKEVGWALFLVYLLLGLLILVFRVHVEYATAAKICFGFALLVTAVFGGIILCNLLGAVIMKLISHFWQKITYTLQGFSNKSSRTSCNERTPRQS